MTSQFVNTQSRWYARPVFFVRDPDENELLFPIEANSPAE